MSLVTVARRNRRNLTDAEALLWKHLRRKQMENKRFRRQQPVGPFIPDFVSFEGMIVVEVDGGQHSLSRELDQKRDEWFEEQDFRVLRFWNNQILKEMESVLDSIRKELKGGIEQGQRS